MHVNIARDMKNMFCCGNKCKPQSEKVLGVGVFRGRVFAASYSYICSRGYTANGENRRLTNIYICTHTHTHTQIHSYKCIYSNTHTYIVLTRTGSDG